MNSARTLDPNVLRAGTTFCMILLALSVLDSGMGDSLLAFPISDVDYLFPSPISRRIVLACRLPGLTFGSVFFSGFVLVIFGSVSRLSSPLPPVGNAHIPGWYSPAAIFFCVATYFNLAMFVSIRLPDRRAIHRVLMASSVLLFGAFGTLWWRLGSQGTTQILNSDLVKWLFLPCRLASDTLVSGFSHHSLGYTVLWLAIIYLASLVPMFIPNSNWYEQSIVSSERISMIRQAAKGGFSAIMAVKSADFKHNGSRIYTLPPFGLGAGALFWAHLCSAWKRPFANFASSAIGGVVLGAFGSFVSIKGGNELLGVGVLAGLGAYATMAFMQVARTASEGALRRRDLLSPLPIPGWQSVAANLGVPVLAYTLFSTVCGLTFLTSSSSFRWPVLFAFTLLLPVRFTARAALQYLVVIGYPDLADKVQQVLALGVYIILSTPLIAVEAIACSPALLFRSIWVALVLVTLLQIPILAAMLWIAGKASEKAVATGEPVNIFKLMSHRK